MIIKKVEVKKFGTFDRYILCFGDHFSVVRHEHADDLMRAIAGSLSYPTLLMEKCEARNEKNGVLSYFVDSLDEISALNSDNILGASKEYMACSIFCNSEDEKFDERLHKYLKASDYYEEKDFNQLTNSFGGTKTFRTYLLSFLKEFTPFRFLSARDVEIYLDKEGYFRCRDPLTRDAIELNAEEKIVFQLFCFQMMHKFWEGAAELRSIQTPDMPLLVGNIPCFSESDIESYMNAFKGGCDTKPQVILFLSGNVDNVPLSVHNERKSGGSLCPLQ